MSRTRIIGPRNVELKRSDMKQARKRDELKATLKSLIDIREWLEVHKNKAKAWAEVNVFIDRVRTPYGIYLTRPALDIIITTLEVEIAKLNEE